MPWRVTYYEPGEAPYNDEMSRFADIWRLAMPLTGEVGWNTLTRYDVESKFANGLNNICVSWIDQDTRTIITKF
jgi:hypothetical protein